ncbi:uncharacterized protein DUF397 [Streptomyces sp. 2333.5]|uniref:DUF397 domain-containing protein n=1 Tax=unclassified Streptomyces TaxID=2593676 RepID=UPI00089AB400|nr:MULTISPECIES: DUF397 domain-containing protein [unclassified Streptomyces]PJJ02491.1 uncharacterized protein DUF397 [Streptomyces sp. 2333.5]SED12609.1 protein of unknown function [Streptomyces sp. 2314.4]SED99772.1 protein of unknown function [Streptomyces sp. 2112.2]
MTIQPNWHKSTYSGENDNCVEVADSDPSMVMFRDSKQEDSAVISVRPAAWASFVSATKAGELGA